MITYNSRFSLLALSTILFILCLMSIVFFFLDIPGRTFFSLSLLGLSWLLLCISRPLFCFSALLFIFVLAYARLGLPLFQLHGPGIRGVVALGDLLWIFYMVEQFIINGLNRRIFIVFKGFQKHLWFIAPFAIVSFLMPLVGVLVGDWPASFAVPGLRVFQWVSFGVLAYSLTLNYSTDIVIKYIVVVMLTSIIFHMFYGFIQLGYSYNILDRYWIYLDDLFVQIHSKSWFFYPRLTGLQVNPNAYGMYSAIVFFIILSMSMAKYQYRKKLITRSAFLASVFGLLFSASRSAYLAIIVSSILWMILMGLSVRHLISRGVILVGKLALSGFLLFLLLWPVFPVSLKDRLTRFIDVLSIGVQMDINAQLRVEEWQRLWNLYINEYPFGTLVPATYATGSGIDSYYVLTAIQGTPIYTFLWVVFILGAIKLGWNSYLIANSRLEATAGISLTGIAGVMAGGGLTLSPMLQPQLVVPFWSIIGVCVAVCNKRKDIINNPKKVNQFVRQK